MSEVYVMRKSMNLQVKRYAETMLPPMFWANDEKGRPKQYTTYNRAGEPEGFIIEKGGTTKIDTATMGDYMKKNLEALKALLRTPAAIPPGCEFELRDTDAEAEELVAMRDLQLEAMNRISVQKADKQFVASMARRLGLASLENQSTTSVLNFVQEKAQNDPAAVLDILNSLYQKELFELDKAKDAELITMRNGFFYYGQLQLGPSEGSVIDFFHRFPDVYDEIVRRNITIFGGVQAASHDEKVREYMAKQAEQQVVAVIPDAVRAGDFVPRDSTGSVAADSETELIIRKGRELGILHENESDEGTYLSFGKVNMKVAGEKGFLKQATMFLMMPANKGIRSQVIKAVKEAGNAVSNTLGHEITVD